MDADGFREWLERYFAAWASNDAEDAVYSFGPFRDDEARGRETIVRRWVDGGTQAGLSTWFEPLALEGDRGVAHWRVSFEEGEGRVELDGILVLDFDGRGRCTLYREWYHMHPAH